MTNKIATDLLAEEGRKLGAGDRLEIGDAHQHQHLRLREIARTPTAANGCVKCTADRIGIGRPGQVLPATSDANEVIGSTAQFFADVVDEKINAAAFADDASQRLAADWFTGSKDRGLDTVHPFAPTRLRRQVIQLPVKQLVS